MSVVSSTQEGYIVPMVSASSSVPASASTVNTSNKMTCASTTDGQERSEMATLSVHRNQSSDHASDLVTTPTFPSYDHQYRRHQKENQLRESVRADINHHWHCTEVRSEDQAQGSASACPDLTMSRVDQGKSPLHRQSAHCSLEDRQSPPQQQMVRSHSTSEVLSPGRYIRMASRLQETSTQSKELRRSSAVCSPNTCTSGRTGSSNNPSASKAYSTQDFASSRHCVSCEDLLDKRHGQSTGTARSASQCQLDKFAPPGSLAPDMVRQTPPRTGHQDSSKYHRMARSTGDIKQLFTSASTTGTITSSNSNSSRSPYDVISHMTGPSAYSATLTMRLSEQDEHNRWRLQSRPSDDKQTYYAVLTELSRNSTKF